MIEDFLKLGDGFFSLMGLKVSLTANVIGQCTCSPASLVRGGGLQQFDRFGGIAAVDLNLTPDRGYRNTIDECVDWEAFAQLICNRSRLANVARYGLRQAGKKQRWPASIHGERRQRSGTRLCLISNQGFRHRLPRRNACCTLFKLSSPRRLNGLAVSFSGFLQLAREGGGFRDRFQHLEFVRLVFCPVRLTLHPRGVAFQKGQDVEVPVIPHAIQLECHLLFADRLGLSKAVKAEVRGSQNSVAESAIRV